MLAKSI